MFCYKICIALYCILFHLYHLQLSKIMSLFPVYVNRLQNFLMNDYLRITVKPPMQFILLVCILWNWALLLEVKRYKSEHSWDTVGWNNLLTLLPTKSGSGCNLVNHDAFFGNMLHNFIWMQDHIDNNTCIYLICILPLASLCSIDLNQRLYIT